MDFAPWPWHSHTGCSAETTLEFLFHSGNDLTYSYTWRDHKTSHKEKRSRRRHFSRQENHSQGSTCFIPATANLSDSAASTTAQPCWDSKPKPAPRTLLNQCTLSKTLAASSEEEPSWTYLSRLLSLSGQEMAWLLPPEFIAAETRAMGWGW